MALTSWHLLLSCFVRTTLIRLSAIVRRMQQTENLRIIHVRIKYRWTSSIARQSSDCLFRIQSQWSNTVQGDHGLHGTNGCFKVTRITQISQILFLAESAESAEIRSHRKHGNHRNWVVLRWATLDLWRDSAIFKQAWYCSRCSIGSKFKQKFSSKLSHRFHRHHRF